MRFTRSGGSFAGDVTADAVSPGRQKKKEAAAERGRLFFLFCRLQSRAASNALHGPFGPVLHEALDRAPCELARLGVTILPAVYGRHRNAERMSELFLRHPQVPAQLADAGSCRILPLHLSFHGHLARPFRPPAATAVPAKKEVFSGTYKRIMDSESVIALTGRVATVLWLPLCFTNDTAFARPM